MKVCPMCKRPFTPEPRRICGRCHGPILRHHKYTFEASMVVHRDCEDPLSYPGEKSVVDGAPLLAESTEVEV